MIGILVLFVLLAITVGPPVIAAMFFGWGDE